jgi:hypothetical protein
MLSSIGTPALLALLGIGALEVGGVAVVIVVGPVFPHQGQVLFPVPAGMPPKLIQSPFATPLPVAAFDVVTVTVPEAVDAEETLVRGNFGPGRNNADIRHIQDRHIDDSGLSVWERCGCEF